MSKNQSVELVSENGVDNNNLKKMNEQVEISENLCVELRKTLRKRSAQNQEGENQIKKRKIEVEPKTIEKDLAESDMSLICLNDDVLREILRHLNWFDSINLTETCVRMRNLYYSWADKRLKEFDLDKYLALRESSLKNIFPRIAPHIGVLKTRMCNMNKTLMKNCGNVNSLLIDDNISRLHTNRMNTWIKKLNLEGLRFHNCDDIDKLLNGVSGLKELEINALNRNSSKIIERNRNLERLSIEVDMNFDYGAFQKLEYLKCLHIRTYDLRNVGEIQKFGHLDGLTEFSLLCQSFSKEPEIMKSFFEYLAKNTQLNKLALVDCTINNEVFNTLKLLKLSALNLCCYYEADGFTKFIQEYSAPLLKHLRLSYCSCEQLYLLITKWSSVETICIYTGMKDDHEEILTDEFLGSILKISQDRPPLRLHVENGRHSKLATHIEVDINFRRQQFTAVIQDEDFCCPTNNVFSFSTEKCFEYYIDLVLLED